MLARTEDIPDELHERLLIVIPFVNRKPMYMYMYLYMHVVLCKDNVVASKCLSKTLCKLYWVCSRTTMSKLNHR